jgi:hypothetical protein
MIPDISACTILQYYILYLSHFNAIMNKMCVCSNKMGCFWSSDGCSLSTAFGNCANEHCRSSCIEKAGMIEDIVDNALKRHIVEDLHPIMEKKFGTWLAAMVEQGLVKVIDIDLFPRHHEPETVASPTQACSSPTISASAEEPLSVPSV